MKQRENNPEKSGIRENTGFLYHYIHMYVRISRIFIGLGCIQLVTDEFQKFMGTKWDLDSNFDI